MLEHLNEALNELVVPLLVTALATAGLWLANWLLLRRANLAVQSHMPRQLAFLVLVAVGLIVVILALPIDSNMRSQLLSLLGLVLTGVIAFSSTTFVANVMAGMMLRTVRSFRTGDFIRVAEHFGRVTERGLFHIEIQSEERDLITLPNLYVASNPVKVVHSSGTIVTCELSLGYDVPHHQVTPLLKQAAQQAGLKEPFVHVRELGDFAISYRACGFYEEVKQLISKCSELRTNVLDQLHGAGIEIVSPTFMNQRQVENQQFAAPPRQVKEDVSVQPVAESLIFDKAERAEKVEALRDELEQLCEEVKQLKTEQPEQKITAEQLITAKQERIALLQRIIEVAEENGKEHD